MADWFKCELAGDRIVHAHQPVFCDLSTLLGSSHALVRHLEQSFAASLDLGCARIRFSDALDGPLHVLTNAIKQFLNSELLLPRLTLNFTCVAARLSDTLNELGPFLRRRPSWVGSLSIKAFKRSNHTQDV
ncbi:hypothetical protein OCOJLMKI_4579 [Methylobacterium iners]|uniref:STAS domain-containing protein n=1 Tax=Methylobacterium iners TaxID=418707 RepID=A0ABQ4S6P4_9HYPH|nr:hypothetical protein OCOJLMKI_4579 [Methylobacterium iners]